MTETLSYDMIIVGSGLAGLRAAITAASKNKTLKIAVLSKVQVMRSHSVSAEGGTAAVLYDNEGDNIESHIYDTIKGRSFNWTDGECLGLGVRMGELIRGNLVDILSLGLHMLKIKLDFMRCRHYMIHVLNLTTYLSLMSGFVLLFSMKGITFKALLA